MVDRHKMEAIAEKEQKDRRKNSLSIEDDGYYDSYPYGTDL